MDEKEFASLYLYLQECFECIKGERKIAATLLLRSCVEILWTFVDTKMAN
jgi:hypothetical protein